MGGGSRLLEKLLVGASDTVETGWWSPREIPSAGGANVGGGAAVPGWRVVGREKRSAVRNRVKGGANRRLSGMPALLPALLPVVAPAIPLILRLSVKVRGAWELTELVVLL